MSKTSVVCLCAFFALLPVFSAGQIGINTVSTVTNIVIPGGALSQNITAHSSSVNGVIPSVNYTVGYNNTGNIKIIDFTYSGKSYVRYAFFDTIIFRRAANPWEPTNGNKQHIYCQGPPSIDNTNHTMPFPVAYPQVTGHAYMEKVMEEGYINRGSDNVFNNDPNSDLTYTNIERVDFVYKPGIHATNAASAGFLIAERGGNDPFKIAAITGIDVNGNPTSFGAVLSVPASAYGNPIVNAATYVMRKDVSDNVLRPFSLVPPQNIKSVFIRLSDLGIAAMQTVYGYALMGNDVTATTSAQLLNYTNSTYYPVNTTASDGGMDMASAPGIFHTDLVLAIQFLSLKAQANNCEQQISWNDDEYSQVKEYQLQKSVNGEDFETITAIPAAAGGDYHFTDKNFTATSWYRVKVIKQTGSYYYSTTYIAKNNCQSVGVSLYPNPAKDYLTVSFNSTGFTERFVNLFSADGKDFGKWMVNRNSRTAELDIKNLPRGHYFVKISGGGSAPKVFQFLKQ